MTDALNIGPVRPSTKPPQDAPPLPNMSNPDATPDFGPDFTRTPEKEPPKVNQKNPPKSTGSVFGKLGQNRKVRSSVPRLTRERQRDDELSHFERLVNWYRAIGNMAEPFHPKFSTAMKAQAEDCANAWFELAETNDTVRRYILAMIEGGAWGKVIAAHTPIFMAVIPERVLTQMFMRGMGLFAKNVGDVSEEDAEEALNDFHFPGTEPR